MGELSAELRMLRRPAPGNDKLLSVNQLDICSPDKIGGSLLALVYRVLVVAESIRPDGSRFRVAEAIVGDETGCVTLSATNDQVDLLLPGQLLLLHNFKLTLFKVV